MTRTIKTECPYCHQPDTLTIDDGVEIIEPVKRACPACWKRKINIDRSDIPTCPECGQGLQDWTDLYLENDGDTAEITCPHCGVDFVTTISIDVRFSNKIKEVEE